MSSSVAEALFYKKKINMKKMFEEIYSVFYIVCFPIIGEYLF